MTLSDIFQAVDQLSAEERRQLREYLDYSEYEGRGMSIDERIQRLHAAAEAIREGLTDEEWAAIERDMNEKYIEEVDDDLWKD